jgi:acetolactate synthase-1/2/3 large subunit
VPDDCGVATLATVHQDAEHALEALADRLGAIAPSRRASDRPPRPRGPLTVESFGLAIASVQPADAIVVDEAATSGVGYFEVASRAPHHSLLTLTGGAIGQGLPCAVGAAIASPGRRVIALQADGSGMFTLQALWTMARERLDVTVVVCANRKYRILQVELARAGVSDPGRSASSLTELSNPDLDWTALAKGMGVEATRVETADQLVGAVERSLAKPGPMVIEALLA